MKKSVVERVIDATKTNRKFNSAIARRCFRGKNKEYIQFIVMRTAARLAEEGRLTRTSRGEYSL